MGLYILKYPYRRILLPLAKKLKWMNPDYLGYLATLIALATMFCYIYANQRPYLLIISIFLTLMRMTLNTIDGVIAIERGNLQLKGEIVNALPDRYSDIFILMGIALSDFCSTELGLFGLASVFIVSYTGMLGKAIGVNWQHQGPLGKVERLILIMIFSLLQYLSIKGVIGNLFSLNWFDHLMLLFVILSQMTVYNRLKGQLRECWKKDWIKYRKNDQQFLVLYDSMTGNTQKVAEEIADALHCQTFNLRNNSEKEFLEIDFQKFDALVWATPNIRKLPTSLLCERIEQWNKKMDESGSFRPKYAIAVTSGMPIWRFWSRFLCARYFVEKMAQKPIAVLHIKGFHAKYKTFRNHPNENDLLTSFLFGIKVCKKSRNALGFLKRLQIQLLRLGVYSLGQWSNGIRLATKEGFISGKMLEYVYANNPQGKNALGKMIDKLFIRNEGWEDVRKRKNNLVDVLEYGINSVLQNNETVRICDIASGPADYILEVLCKYRDKKIEAELRDLDSRWLDDAKTKAEKLGIAEMITTKTANALDPSDFIFDTIPDMIVSSGFYDWFENDSDVIDSMKLIYQTLQTGGFFAFTNQSGHIDLTLINGVFTDFNQKELKMKVRKAELVNHWAEMTGFKIIQTKTDNKQRYSVTLAQKQ